MSNRIKTSNAVPCRQLVNGQFEDAEPAIVIETELRIIVNGKHLATASLMPGMAHEFVTGYLFGQCFIETLDDIERLNIRGTTASVTLSKPIETDRTSYRIVSGGGRTACTSGPLPRITSDLKLKTSTIFKAMNRLFEAATAYQETEGVHAAGIFTAQAEPLIVAEDIGRHNCLDKVIGYTLLNGVDTSICLLASTGRMASEMVDKIGRAGIPVAATKTAVTDQGLATAKACGLTLIGFVRDTGNTVHTDMEIRTIEKPVMKIYTGVERISC